MSIKYKIYKIWAGDYSAEGIDEGVKDRMEGKPNWGSYKFFKVAHPINWFWNFDQAYDSFVKNYKKGYEQAGLALNGIYDGSLQNAKIKSGGTNMGNAIKSYDDAISVLRRMKQEMQSTLGEINLRKKNYKDFINHAETNGWMQDYIDELRKRQARFDDEMDKFISVVNQLIEEIEKDIKRLEFLRQNAKGN